VEGVRIVEMAHVIVQKRVRTVLEIVVHVLPHHLRIVAMDRVMVANPVRRVLEIVARVLLHHLQRIVGMVRVIMGKIVRHVLVIVLERIHVSTVHLQIGKHPLGWNVVHHVEILLHGFQNIVKVVVVLYKISQSLLHIIMV
jgi:hypothetical protein